MLNEIISLPSECWSSIATLIAGLLTAIATFGAVIYTNNRTKQQLKDQAIAFEKTRKEEFKQNKFVYIFVAL